MANTSGAQLAIVSADGRQTMNADAAKHFNALIANIKSETGISIVATEGTRTYARQKYLYDNRNKPGFNPAWSPDSPFAYHLSGRAVDVGSNVGYVITDSSRAFYSRAGKYGFRPTVKGEPWHFEWRADWVGVSLESAASNAAPFPSPAEQSEEDDLTPIESSQLANLHAAFFAGLNGVEALSPAIVATKAAVAATANRFALVRKDGKPEVFLSVDRQELRWIKSEASLKDQRYTLNSLGSPAANAPVQVVSNLEAFGTIIGEKPVGY